MPFYKKFLAFILLVSSAASAVFSLYVILEKQSPVLSNNSYNFSPAEFNSFPVFTFSNNTSYNLTTNNQSEALATTTNGKVLGKIQETVLSPYSAPVSYNKVYLKNSTGIAIDLKKELSQKINIDIKKSLEPEVLIFSTHTTESYMLESRNYYTDKDATGTTDSSKNVVRIGNILKQKLEQNGFSVMQSSTMHDHPKFSGCYDRSAETVKSYLKKYPSIKIVIDIHRDSVNYDDGTKIKPTVVISGKKAAQIMFVAGCEAGEVSGFPAWRENLRLAAKIHQSVESMYPSLARPITFTARKYNLHLTNGSLLIEIGTEANTLSEAEYSAELLSNALIKVLNEL